jgi:cell division septum initiation protein DivIVA
VRLTVDGQTLTSPLRIVPDPERSAPQADLDAQLQFALRVRDDISKLTAVVNRVRSVREQLQARVKALESRKAETTVATLISGAEGSIKKAIALEDRLHNPSAEVVYDILAERGGTRLYSRLAPLMMWAVEGEGQPTVGMLQVLEAQEKELAQLEQETDAWVTTDVAAVNRQAASAGVQFIVVK